MGDNKMWTRADARAEIARVFGSTLEARKVLHAAVDTIRQIGEESGFKDDAKAAILRLQQTALRGATVDGPPELSSTERYPCALSARRQGLIYDEMSKSWRKP